MARILVVGDKSGLAARSLLDAVVGRLTADGHDADVLPGPDALMDADALVAVLDGALPSEAAVALGRAAGMGKPVFGLHGGDAPPALVAACTATATAADVPALLDSLPGFYDAVRPFAGRLVRDLVPRLVEEAGHDVRFRALAPEERPRFLKQKIHEEATALRSSDRGDEIEEIGDLLEALETLIRDRGYEREELRRVKDGKRKRRGGFEQGFVVEATADTRSAGDASEATDAQAGDEGPATTAHAVERDDGDTPTTGDGRAPDEADAPVEPAPPRPTDDRDVAFEI